MSVQERLTNGNGFRILMSHPSEDVSYETYEKNEPFNNENKQNKLSVNAIYFPTDAKLLELGYWEELFRLDVDGNRFSEGWYYRDYIEEWAGGDFNDETQVLGGNLSDLYKGGQNIKAGTWLYAPQGHPFDYIVIEYNEKKEYVILY